ncbi:MAG: heparinase II/III domain-containing protein, partial [Planctomycetota bacterium]
MSLYLTDDEHQQIVDCWKSRPMNQFVWALNNRCHKRAQDAGLLTHDTTVRWWHCYAEYVTDAAMLQALKPDENIAAWLRETVLSAVQRPVDDWIGPWFRNHDDPPTGHLETAHLSWATAVALDLCPSIFSEDDRHKIRAALIERAIPMCRRWLDNKSTLHNWRCVLLAGLAGAAAVLGDAAQLDYCTEHFKLCVKSFQPDGSYGESLQYSNYAMYALMITYESLIRARPEAAGDLPIDRYARSMRWHAASLFYMKPLEGWGPFPRPRAANFNDSAAMFAPSTDLLFHIAARCRESLPTEAGLARWIQKKYCPAVPDSNTGNSSTFGFINKFGFLSIPLLPQAADPVDPHEAGLSELEAFSNGDVMVRDRWDGQTILAIHGGGDPLNTTGHLHGDLNSFILVHNNQRLLVDPGHSCYRNMIHELEVTTEAHNAVTFVVREGNSGQNDAGTSTSVQQQNTADKRVIGKDGELNEPVNRGARRLLADSIGKVRVVGSEAASLYGDPIDEWSRFWIMCGSHALFIVDRIRAIQPVRTTWNWILNNRDGLTEFKPVHPDRMVVRRGTAGMKLFTPGGVAFQG